MKRRKIAIVYPRFGGGGSEARALWALQTLRRDHDLTLLTYGPGDLARLNPYYGTDLQPGDFRLWPVPIPPGIAGSTFNFLEFCFFQRYCKRVASQFDLMISAYNPCDFGRPGIQCVADFSFLPEQRYRFDPNLQEAEGFRYRNSLVFQAYLKVCEIVAPFNPAGWGTGMVIANSQWTAGLLREMFGIQSRLLYPPVPGGFPEVPFAEREPGFVCLGRLVPEKRVEVAIEIAAKVRASGHPEIHLHLIGAIDDSPYGNMIRRLCARYRDWVFPEGALSGEAKRRLLATHRYGIHARQKEPFGIAVAELVKAGCITFVPSDGGQTEIVDHQALTYASAEEAAGKIQGVLDRPELQCDLSLHLLTAGRRFSVEAFKRGFLEAVTDFLDGDRAAPG